MINFEQFLFFIRLKSLFCFVLKLIFLIAVGNSAKKFEALSAKVFNILSAVADSAKNFKLPSPKALKNVLKNITLFCLKKYFCKRCRHQR
jgi:hypothetical protein